MFLIVSLHNVKKPQKVKICAHIFTVQCQERDYRGVHHDSVGSVFTHSNDELSPPPSSELMPVVMHSDRTELEEALRQISREISSEFSCARDTDLGISPGDTQVTKLI